MQVWSVGLSKRCLCARPTVVESRQPAYKLELERVLEESRRSRGARQKSKGKISRYAVAAGRIRIQSSELELEVEMKREAVSLVPGVELGKQTVVSKVVWRRPPLAPLAQA
jgi:hypothetical protein